MNEILVLRILSVIIAVVFYPILIFFSFEIYDVLGFGTVLLAWAVTISTTWWYFKLLRERR